MNFAKLHNYRWTSRLVRASASAARIRFSPSSHLDRPPTSTLHLNRMMNAPTVNAEIFMECLCTSLYTQIRHIVDIIRHARIHK